MRVSWDAERAETIMNKVVFENKQEIIVFLKDGRLLHTHKNKLFPAPQSRYLVGFRKRRRPLSMAMSGGEN
jgi:hypothetical protein